MDEGFMAEARADTVKQEVYVALQYAASFHCVQWRNGKIVKNLSPSRKKSGGSLTGRVRE